MRVLLDTCAIAEIRKPRPNAAVMAVIKAISDAMLFLSVLSVGEIAKGVALLEAGARRDELSAWLSAMRDRRFSGRTLPLDVEIAITWAELTARARKTGRVLPPIDGLIAATALCHGLHVMTRNEKDFAESGAAVLNPRREA